MDVRARPRAFADGEGAGHQADFVENVPESADAERVITELAQNHDLIFTTSFGYMEYTLNVAKKFPKVIFMHASGYKTADNMGTYFGRNYQASYLAGISAGKMTKKERDRLRRRVPDSGSHL